LLIKILVFFFFQAEDGIRDFHVTGVQTCALPIFSSDRADLEGVPDQLEDRAYGRYTVLWPVASHAEQVPERTEYTWRRVSRTWQIGRASRRERVSIAMGVLTFVNIYMNTKLVLMS